MVAFAAVLVVVVHRVPTVNNGCAKRPYVESRCSYLGTRAALGRRIRVFAGPLATDGKASDRPVGTVRSGAAPRTLKRSAEFDERGRQFARGRLSLRRNAGRVELWDWLCDLQEQTTRGARRGTASSCHSQRSGF